METFSKTQRALAALPNGRWGGHDPFCADSSEDQQVISPERWRAWEEKTRLRGKANARKITVAASAALLALWLVCMITSYTLGGSVHILLIVAVAALVIHALHSRRSIR